MELVTDKTYLYMQFAISWPLAILLVIFMLLYFWLFSCSRRWHSARNHR